MKVTKIASFACVVLLSSQLLSSATVVAETTSEPTEPTVQSSEALTQNSILPKSEQEATLATTTESVADENQTVPSSSISEGSDSTAETSKEETSETSNFNKSEKTENTASSEEQTDSPSPQADTRAINLANWRISVNGNIASITDYTGNEQTVVVPALNDLKAANPTTYGACTEVQISRNVLSDVNGTSATSVSISTNGSKVKFVDNSLANLFIRNNKLRSVNLNGLDTSNVTDMSYMFYSCESLASLNLSSFDTSQVTNMSYMFYNCAALTSLNLSSFDTSQVTNMSYMFNTCAALTSLNLSSFDTSQVTNMSYMFYYCRGLTSLDVSNFDTSNVTTMEAMFDQCRGLTSLDLSNFDTSNVTTMQAMFGQCTSLTSLDVSSFDTSQVRNMYYMFVNCESLTILDLSSFELSKVTNKARMFDCYNRNDPFRTYPLMVITNDNNLLNYNYTLDYRTAPTLKFNANGGTFADGTTEKAYFTSCAIQPVDATIEKIKEFAKNNEPTKAPFTFNKWTDASGTPLEQATDFNAQLNNTYTAQWTKALPNAPEGSEKTGLSSTNPLGLYYVPKPMTLAPTELQEKGSQTIPFNEGYGFHVGIKDENANQTWQLKVKLQWKTPGLENSYIQTKNTAGTVNQNNNNGTNPVQSSDFQATTVIMGQSNIKIGSQETELMSSATGTKDGVYDYALEQAELVLPDASIVPPNNYQGTLHWNLVQAP